MSRGNDDEALHKSSLLAIGVDVGSIRRKGGFAWSSADALVRGADEPIALGTVVVDALKSGRHVALAFECPLSVPVPDAADENWRDLGRARTGEGNRSWSAGAGTGALATGLVQLTWLLGYVRAGIGSQLRATTQVDRFPSGERSLLLAEAMVTGDGKPEPVGGLQDEADALAAARRLDEILGGRLAEAERIQSDVVCAPHTPLNLAALSALHAGVMIDADELRLDVLVAKVKPDHSRRL